MNKKYSARIFGAYDPYIGDNKLLSLHTAYINSSAYKEIAESRVKYLLEKWNFMRKFFEAEFIANEIDKVNVDFNINGISNKEKFQQLKT